MNNILYEDNHILVVVKPINMPVCEDDSKDLDLLTSLKNYIKDKYNKPGNVYLGLIHRLDRPVSGVMVFAKTSKAASRLSEQLRLKKLKKQYHAIIHGKVGSGTYIDKLLKDKLNNITKVDENGKESILEYRLIEYNKENNFSLVKIDLKTGRSHQIRVQFSSRNFPLVGDVKYGSKIKMPICLISTRLEFIHPVKDEKMIFEIELPKTKIWSLFKIT